MAGIYGKGKPTETDFKAEKLELKAMKRGVPHAKAEKMERAYLKRARGRNGRSSR